APGPHLLGFVFAPSRRRLPPEVAAEIAGRCRLLFPPRERQWAAVGVFANQPLESVADASTRAGLDYVQLSGEESPDYCRRLGLPLYRAVQVGNPAGVLTGSGGGAAGLRDALDRLRIEHGATRLLLDSGGGGRWGGTGIPFRWEQVGDAARDCLVAGGLNPENVARAVATLRPWGVDVSSGVERDGKKDLTLIREFVRNARGGA
ncbi:MAG: phosphoribosylanthranilate isomerase, partial [Chloroflexota bacterium]